MVKQALKHLLLPFSAVRSTIAAGIFFVGAIGIARPSVSWSAPLFIGWQDRLWIRFGLGCVCLSGLYLYLTQEPNTGHRREPGVLDNVLDSWRRLLTKMKQERESVRISSRAKDLQTNELYRAAIQLVAHTETMSWSRMSTFLTSSSILLVAWATILYQIKEPSLAIVIAAIGLMLSSAWAPFGSRNRRLHTLYADVARALERKAAKTASGPIVADKAINYLLLEDLFRSQRLVVGLPLIFAATFWLLLLKSIQFFLTATPVPAPATWPWPCF